MIFMVTFLLVMIFVYAMGYMTFPGHLASRTIRVSAYAQNKDPRYSRFMAYISLFATGMLGLVVELAADLLSSSGKSWVVQRMHADQLLV